MNLDAIKKRIQNRQPVTESDYLELLRHDKHTFWAFLISNNPGNVNDTLRHKLGYIELGFNPDQKAIARIIEIMIARQEVGELEQVLKNFALKTDGLTPEFINALQTEFTR